MSDAAAPFLAHLPSGIGGTFRRMAIAEEMLAEFGLGKHPHAFRWLCPPACLVHLDERAYRSHCRELLERIAMRGPGAERARATELFAIRHRIDFIRVPTDAEVLAHLSGASLIAPPGAQFAALFETLFERVMGYLPNEETRVREPWQGASAELLGECRRTLAHDVERTRLEGKAMLENAEHEGAVGKKKTRKKR